MKANRMRYSASLKLILGVFLAACFFATTVHAKAFYIGTFKLSNETHWGKAVLPPGTYSLTLDQFDQNTRTFTLRNARTGKLVVCEVAKIDRNTDNDDSELLITMHDNQREVSSARLAGVGEIYPTFRHGPPSSKSERAAEEARSTEVIPVQIVQKQGKL